MALFENLEVREGMVDIEDGAFVETEFMGNLADTNGSLCFYAKSRIAKHFSIAGTFLNPFKSIQHSLCSS